MLLRAALPCRSWWRPGETRGRVWMDCPPAPPHGVAGRDPPAAASSSTDHLEYRGTGLRAYLRMARIVVDAFRAERGDVRW